MTEGDIIEAAAAAIANSMSGFTVFITFTFGFLATAYIVGGKLTRLQALTATGLYVVAAGYTTLTIVAWMQAFFAITEVKATALDTVPLIQRGYWVQSTIVLLSMGILISLYFMWSVRHRKTE
jgi:hypothetical protein